MDFLIYTGIVIVSESGALTRGEMDSDGTTPVQESRPPETVSGEPRRRLNIPAQTVDGHDKRQIALTVHVHIRTLDELTPANATRLNEWLRTLNEGGQAASVTIDTEDAEG